MSRTRPASRSKFPQPDIVVIGGSAGSLSPLREVLSALAGFPASVFVVVHMPEDAPGLLDGLLSKAGPLPACYPVDNEPIRLSRVYLARADHHLMLQNGHIRIPRAPRENRHRPAIDPLFRTAARERGPSVIGVILSGQDDDGAAGLFAVKQRGGIGIVQDPRDAAAGTMPESALEYGSPQYVLRTREIAPSLIRLVNADQDVKAMSNKNRKQQHPKKAVNRNRSQTRTRGRTKPPPTSMRAKARPLSSPAPSVMASCGSLKIRSLIRFRCRLGHSYGIQSLARELSQSSETALWAAMRALEEKAAMQRRIADDLGGSKTSKRLRDQSSADGANARVIREMIFRRDQKLETYDPAREKAA